jgi:MoaA/NifB/PqqE/SkfB family radical SAM enzyme
MIKKKRKIPDYILYSNAFDDRKVYRTRAEIMEAEKELYEPGCIRWDEFDRLVAEGRKKIEEDLARAREKEQKLLAEKENKKKEVYGVCAYSLESDELLGEYTSLSAAAFAFDITNTTIENALYRRNGRYLKGNVRFVRQYVQAS